MPGRLILLAVLAIAGATTAYADAARDLRLRQDLDFLLSSIRARHPNPYTKVSSAELDRLREELSNDIPSLTDIQAYLRMKSIAASIGDAHTTLFLRSAYSDLGVRRFPIRFTLYDDGLFVSVTTESFPAHLGRRVVTVNGRTPPELIDGIRPWVSFDNEQFLKQRLNDILVSPQLLHAAGLGADPEAADIVLEDGLGRRESLRVSGGDESFVHAVNHPSVGYLSPTYLDPRFEYWFRYYPEQKLLFFKYNRCRERADLSFADFAADLFRTLDSEAVDHLVVDLRDNTGGNSELWRPFLNGLNARYAALRTGNPSFGFYGLISRLTFSSGIFAAQEIKRFPGALLIGEGTGGNPEHFGNAVSFRLPNLTNAFLSVSTKFFRPFGPGVTPPTVAPDLSVPRNSGDVFARFDPILFAVFALGGRTGSAADAGAISSSVVSAAAFRAGGVQSPGALSSVFGDFGAGAPTVAASTVPLPRRLADVEVLVGGQTAPLLLVSPFQINFQQPAGPFAESETVIVRNGGENVWTGVEATASSAPALFTSDFSNFRKPGAVLNQDGSLNSRENPARRGERIQIFATGYPELAVPVEPGSAPPAGTLARTRSTPRVLIGQWDMQVEFSGASPEFPGLWQINALIPAAAGIEKLMPLAILEGGRVSNAVSVWVE